MRTSNTNRVMPHDKNIEVAVIGAILLERDAFKQVASILTYDMFYDDRHSIVFDVCQQLFIAGEPIDLATVSFAIRQRTLTKEQQKEISPYFLAALTQHINSAANIERHARILVELWARRHQINMLDACIGKFYDQTEDVFETSSNLEAQLMDLNKKMNSGKSIHFADIFTQFIENLYKKRTITNGITGVPSGFYELDHITSGFQNGHLIILAGRPAMGKTAMVITMALNAMEKDCNVGIFSLEMSCAAVMARIVSQSAMIDGEKIKNGQLSDEDMQNIIKSTGKYEKKTGNKLFIDDTPAINLVAFKAKCLQMLDAGDKNKPTLIIVDYLQLMKATGNNRVEEVSVISRTLKQYAKELNVPIIALSQLSRAVESRGGDKRPMLSDLRESGSIEQDADQVMFLYRPEYYGIMEDEEGKDTRGLVEVIIGKNRDGRVGTVQLQFLANYTKIVSENVKVEPPSKTSALDSSSSEIVQNFEKKNFEDMPF